MNRVPKKIAVKQRKQAVPAVTVRRLAMAVSGEECWSKDDEAAEISVLVVRIRYHSKTEDLLVNVVCGGVVLHMD